MALTLLSLLGGLALLILGGEWLVAGASRLATRFGIAPLVVGLTVVAFGTSAPEIMVTASAAWEGGPAGNLALGNVVGSNIFNVLAILGVCALLAPLVVQGSMLRRELPLMVLVSALTLWLGRDGLYSRGEGALLFAILLLYLLVLLRQVRQGQPAPTETATASAATGHVGPSLLRIIAGLVLLVLGARWLVAGAVEIATLIGLSETVIGLTIVAAGTSLPEVAASVMATVRGERDIAVGNIVGSNIFNLCAALAVAAIVAPAGVAAPASIRAFDGPVMLAVALLCVPVFLSGQRIGRWEGAMLLGYYVAYVTYLVLVATQSAALAWYSPLMLYGVVPVTALVVLANLARAVTQRRQLAHKS